MSNYTLKQVKNHPITYTCQTVGYAFRTDLLMEHTQNALLLISSSHQIATKKDFFEHIPVASMLKIAKDIPLHLIWILTQCSSKWRIVCYDPSNWSSRLPNCFISWVNKEHDYRIMRHWSAEASERQFKMTQMCVSSWAVNVISNAQLKRLSNHMCDICTNNRVLKELVDDYEMKPTISGGSGYKCWRHLCTLCTCQKQVYYRTEYCPGCGCFKCVLCSRRCRCINNN
jgi:hypothetical protein